MKYKVGNLLIDSNKTLSIAWEPFKCCMDVCSNEISVQFTDSILVETTDDTITHPQFTTTSTTDGCIYKFLGEAPSVMQVDKDYTKVQITEGEGKEYLLRLAVECRLIKEGFISLHGACVISPNGKAIIFTGDSGVGKSTRAAAWKDALGLKMISGDRPLIDTKACIAYGVPWDGKEGIYVNLQAPISVIFNVIRAEKDECEINLVSKMEALKILLAQTFMPMWDTDLAARAMQNLNHVINSSVKIANLVSGWDEAAAIKAWGKTNECIK